MVLTPATGPLRPIGTLSRADAAGHLPRLGRAPSGPIGRSVDDFAKALHSAMGDAGASIVLRGSLARGASAPADIDLMIITGAEITLPPLESLPPLPLPVEANIVPRATFDGPGGRGAWVRFALAHCGWTLAGPDLLTALPPPRLDRTAIAHLRNVARWWPHQPLDWAVSMAERRLIQQWLAKRVLRALAEGEMVRRGLYSRDIWPCLTLAAQAYPTRRAALADIAEQAIAPSGHWRDMARMVDAARRPLELAFLRHLHRTLRLPVR